MSLSSDGLRITWIGFSINLSLGVLKTGAGWLLNSKALIADGIHSLLDLLSDVVVLFGIFMARRPEDATHLYGHHKFATLSKLLIGAGLVVLSLGLVVTAALSFNSGSNQRPAAGWAALLALLSLPVKELLFWSTRAVARKIKSDLVMANAWHHRADSLSTLGVAVALFCVWLGGESWAFLDDVVTVFLGGYLVFEAGKILLGATAELLDTAPQRSIIEDFREHILSTPGAEAYHDFRVRKVGDVYEVDFHLQVAPDLSVERGHDIARDVKRRMLEQHPEVWHVLIHIEPANNEHLQDRGISDTGVGINDTLDGSTMTSTVTPEE
ncbi:MAG: cation diffusion facilitator family transporter [Coraliomargarita sp.]